MDGELRCKYTFVSPKVTFTSANTTSLHSIFYFFFWWWDYGRTCDGNQTGSCKTKGIKKGLKPVDLHEVWGWTERQDNICVLATVLLYCYYCSLILFTT